jgi:hypothetical protein
VEPGEHVQVEVWQRALAQPMRGFQMFITFDEARLTHVQTTFEDCGASELPGCPAPCGLIIRNAVTDGLIDIAVGIDDAVLQPITTATRRIATLVFEAASCWFCRDKGCRR